MIAWRRKISEPYLCRLHFHDSTHLPPLISSPILYFSSILDPYTGPLLVSYLPLFLPSSYSWFPPISSFSRLLPLLLLFPLVWIICGIRDLFLHRFSPSLGFCQPSGNNDIYDSKEKGEKNGHNREFSNKITPDPKCTFINY